MTCHCGLKNHKPKVELTVITSTIPGREEYLARNMESVKNQSVLPFAHLIFADARRLGYDYGYNTLVQAVETEFFAILNDDNYWFPNHVETVLPLMRDADVIVTKDAGLTRPCEDFSSMTQEHIVNTLATANMIDANCAIRTSFFREIGGLRHRDDRFSDWDLFERMAQAGARLVSTQEETWFYDVETPNRASA